jgi:transposase
MKHTPITLSEREHRRKRAVAAVGEGQPPATVAKVLGVSRGSVYRWLQMADQPNGLDPKPYRREPALSDQQLQRLATLLLEGATRHGWSTDLWTASRVRQMILRHFGIAFHPEHVRKMLKRRLGWSSQKPQKRSEKRDEEEIERWRREEFPRIVREAQGRGAHLVFLDESGFRMSPTARRTLAPRGQTPILKCGEQRDKISAISAITLSPRWHLPGLAFQLLPDKENFHAEEVLDFLKALRRRFRRFTVIWDRSRIHGRSRVVRAYLGQHPEIVAEDLPAYAPELNPDELVWCWTKYGRMANYAAPDMRALRERVESELGYLEKHSYDLLDFVDHTELTLAA